LDDEKLKSLRLPSYPRKDGQAKLAWVAG